MKKILITGASGFIGSFIVEEALRRGLETWAAVRPTSSLRYLQDDRVHLLTLDLQDPARLMDQLRPHRFDYIVHAAGATKCQDPADFFRVNCDGTRHLFQAVRALAMPVERIVFLSSLSVFGAIHETQPYTPITEADQPRPNTCYGRSKLEAEQVALESGLPVVILRPTGVYGPREHDYFMMAKSIKGHTDFAVGFQQQDITFVYVKDVVAAVFLALTRGAVGRAYFLTDGAVYQSAAFSDLIHEALGRPWWIRVTAPIWVLRLVCGAGEWYGRRTGQLIALNKDKFNILRQRNWQCDIEPARRELGFQPQYDLRRGVEETIRWYQDHKWL